MLKYIKLGTNYKKYFNYNGQPLPIRALSSYELDEIIKKVVRGLPTTIFNNVLEFKLNLIDKKELELDLNKENFEAFCYFWDEMDYWVVYYAMKDFQEEDFSEPDFEGDFRADFEDWNENNPKGYYLVRKMAYIHRIAQDIYNMTSQPDKKIVELLSNSEGKTLATKVYTFHEPLAGEAWKLTPLQTKFLWFARPGAPEVVNDIDDIPGISGGKLGDIAKQLRKMGLNA